MKTPIRFGLFAAGGFVVLLVGMAIGSPSSPSTPAVPTPAAGQVVEPTEAPFAAPTPAVVKTKQFAGEFETNQVAAEKKWGGAYVQLTATVTNINSSGVSFANVLGQFNLTQISCRVADENQLVNLVKGKPATVRGIVGGDQILGVISLNDCEIVR